MPKWCLLPSKERSTEHCGLSLLSSNSTFFWDIKLRMPPKVHYITVSFMGLAIQTLVGKRAVTVELCYTVSSSSDCSFSLPTKRVG